ncbi:thiol-specific monooxygenase [Hyaloscypha variabilis F]|uniref:Thiol-specific monooxygenase n=1 Tax=Hyaloscypha variabilis (strain UAMH 11265 / GT02V1 / F) TaxID=1149755 RepID=A0A2J6S454_HYAVF|nr:thiol-specific monooxygenase [Hyaloscypha variabilis F]
MVAVKRVAVIGAGPAGAITIDALAKEKSFDLIRVFERREAPGGCWLADKQPPPLLSDLAALASRSADAPIPLPDRLPAQRPKIANPRYAESSIYPYLETNIDSIPMEFTQEPIPAERSQRSIALHGHDTPFRHWSVMQRYIQGLVDRNGYQDLVSYNTTVERAEKVGHEWKVTLRKDGAEKDYWWVEWFDAVVVASGHYSVPYVPAIEGLEQFEKLRPGSVMHSKQFRGKEYFQGKRVVIVGASVSGADVAVDLVNTAVSPVYAVVSGHRANAYFGDEAFNHSQISKQPSISRIEARNVHFVDGNSVRDVDNIIFGTGYSWTLPFLPQVEVRNNRVPNLYQHVVYQKDPTLLFVGAVAAGLTFKIFEYQAVLAARILAGRAILPPLAEQEKWEQDRIAARGDGPKFTLVFPDFEDYFEDVRALAGPGEHGLGRQLPPFKREWFKAFLDGHELRKKMWRRINAQAWDELDVNLNGLDLGGQKKTRSPPPTYGPDLLNKIPNVTQRGRLDPSIVG